MLSRCGEISIFCGCGKKFAIPTLKSRANEARVECLDCRVQIVHARPSNTRKDVELAIPTSQFIADWVTND